MKMNVTETVRQACGHWPRILPALGVKVIKNRHQTCPVYGGSDRFRFDDIVPLSRQAMILLDQLKQISGDRELLFPGDHDATRVMVRNACEHFHKKSI